MQQVKPKVTTAVVETTNNTEHFYTGTIVINSNSPKVFVEFTRQDRVTIDARGLNEQTHIPVHPNQETIESSIAEALECCEEWLQSIIDRLKGNSAISSMELIIMFRREIGDKTGRLYARKEVLNQKNIPKKAR